MVDSKPSSSSAPIRVDGSEIDAALSNSEFLTRAEVLSRRSRRLKQLAGIYRDHYWALMHELKSRHREYVWEYAKSPVVDDEENWETDLNCPDGNLGVRCRVNEGKCRAHGCRAHAMELTTFCHMHILADPNQKLYKPCAFRINVTSAADPIFCGKPAMASTVPLYCPAHFDKAEKLTVRALRNVGLNVPITSKIAPKAHVLISEFVHQIQVKRRVAEQTNLSIAEPVKKKNKKHAT